MAAGQRSRRDPDPGAARRGGRDLRGEAQRHRRTPPGCVSSRATPPCCAAPRPPCAPIWRSAPPSAPAWPTPTYPRMPSRCSRTLQREGARELLRAKRWVDLLVPRGGPGLLAQIEAEATVPVGDRRCRELPRLRGCSRRPRPGGVGGGQRQDAPPRCVQRRREAPRPPVGGCGVPAHEWPRS